MKFSDIVTLAKAGYKPSDVKELLELCETDPSTKNKEVNTESNDSAISSNESKEPELDAFEKLVKENS